MADGQSPMSSPPSWSQHVDGAQRTLNVALALCRQMENAPALYLRCIRDLPDARTLATAAITELLRDYERRHGTPGLQCEIPDGLSRSLNGLAHADPTAPDLLARVSAKLLANYGPETAQRQARRHLADQLWRDFWLSRDDGMKVVAGCVVLTATGIYGGRGRLDYPSNDRLYQILRRLIEASATTPEEAKAWYAAHSAAWNRYDELHRPDGRKDFPELPFATVRLFKEKAEVHIALDQAERLNGFFQLHRSTDRD